MQLSPDFVPKETAIRALKGLYQSFMGTVGLGLLDLLYSFVTNKPLLTQVLSDAGLNPWVTMAAVLAIGTLGRTLDNLRKQTIWRKPKVPYGR